MKITSMNNIPNNNVNFKGIGGPFRGKFVAKLCNNKLFNDVFSKNGLGIDDYTMNRLTYYFMTMVPMMGARIAFSRDKDERREVLLRDPLGLTTIFLGVPFFKKLLSNYIPEKTGFPVLDEAKFLFFKKNKGSLSPLEQIKNWFIVKNEYTNGLITSCENLNNHKSNLNKIFDVLQGKTPDEIEQMEKVLNKNIASQKQYKLFGNSIDEYINNFIGKFKSKSINKLTAKIEDSKGAAEAKEALNKIKELFSQGKDLGDNNNFIDMLKEAKNSAEGNIHYQKLENYLKKSTNQILTKAKYMKALPDLLSMGLTAGILGIFLPWFNIKVTRKKYKNGEVQQNTNKINKSFQGQLDQTQKTIYNNFLKH